MPHCSSGQPPLAMGQLRECPRNHEEREWRGVPFSEPLARPVRCPAAGRDRDRAAGYRRPEIRRKRPRDPRRAGALGRGLAWRHLRRGDLGRLGLSSWRACGRQSPITASWASSWSMACRKPPPRSPARTAGPGGRRPGAQAQRPLPWSGAMTDHRAQAPGMCTSTPRRRSADAPGEPLLPPRVVFYQGATSGVAAQGTQHAQQASHHRRRLPDGRRHRNGRGRQWQERQQWQELQLRQLPAGSRQERQRLQAAGSGQEGRHLLL